MRPRRLGGNILSVSRARRKLTALAWSVSFFGATGIVKRRVMAYMTSAATTSLWRR